MAHDEFRGPAFPVDEFDARVARVREGLVARGLDAGVFFAPQSIYYLCGYDYPTHFAYQLLVVPVDGDAFMVLREVNASGARTTTYLDECAGFTDSEDPVATTRDRIAAHGLAGARLGLEEQAPFLSVAVMRALVAALPDVRWGDCSGIVESLRLVKSPREVTVMREAARVSDAGLDAARAAAAAGATEAEMASEVSRCMLMAGGEYPAVPLVLGIEERSRVAMPCHPSPERRMAPGETLWVEVFGTVRRYAAGLKANFGAGPVEDDVAPRFETAQRAIARAVDAIAPDRPASVVPEAVIETFREAGFGEATAHHQSGYSVGIAFSPNPHEARMLSLRRDNDTPLRPGMTLFPIANLYGPRTTMTGSAFVVVTQDGAEVINRFRSSPDDLAL